MPFRLRTDAREWFRDIKTPVDFDIYYFCLMVGLAANRKPEVKAEAKDLVNDFPELYKKNNRLILALFLSRELRSKGIKLNEKVELHAEISHLVDATEPSRLSEHGMHELNRYASGGYEALIEEFPDRPRYLETFLPEYKKYLESHLGSAENI